MSQARKIICSNSMLSKRPHIYITMVLKLYVKIRPKMIIKVWYNIQTIMKKNHIHFHLEQ